MPDVRLPDGTIVQNVPDGVTQSELISRLQKANHPSASSLGVSVKQSGNDLQQMPSISQPGRAAILPVLPRGGDAGVAQEQSIDRGTKGQGSRQELRQRVQAPGENTPSAMPGMRPGSANASPGLQPSS